jgi:transposase
MKHLKKTRKRTSASHKLRCVRLVLGGLSAVKVGRKYGNSPRAVANWVQRFKKQGAKALHEAPHTGRPPTINPSQMKKLKSFVSRARTRSEPVSGRILAEFIKRSYGVTLTRQQARRILNRLDS